MAAAAAASIPAAICSHGLPDCPVVPDQGKHCQDDVSPFVSYAGSPIVLYATLTRVDLLHATLPWLLCGMPGGDTHHRPLRCGCFSSRRALCVLLVVYVLPPLLSWAAMLLIPTRVQQWLPSVPASLRPRSSFEVPTASSLLKVVGVAALVGGTYALLRRVLDAELTTFEPSVPGLHARSMHLEASRRARLLGCRFNHQVAQLYSHRVRWGYLAPLHRTFVADSNRLYRAVANASPADLNAALPFTNIVSHCRRGGVGGGVFVHLPPHIRARWLTMHC